MKTLRKTTRKRLQACRSKASVRPATQTRRLGDGFYEQKLIREQIAELTGRRFLDDYTSDEEQYTALMNAGVQFARDYGLIPGVALTAEQMARLTTDIVWLVAKEVTLPDVTKTRALVPQDYALVKPGDIDGSGNLLSAKSIDLKLKGDMVNSGLMAARGNLSIDAANITNLTGTIKGVDVSLVASQDIQSIQGNIIAGNDLKIKAGNDVVILAGNVTAGGNASINAGHDLLIIAQEKGRQVSANWGKLKKDKDGNDIPGQYENKDNSLSYGTYDQTGANISVGGGLSMSAGNDFYAQGTQINAGSVSVSAGRDATITNALKGSFYESSSVRKQKTWWGLGSKTTTHITRNTDTTNIETNWNAGNISANAGRDLTIVGGNFNAAGGINLGAGNNVNVMAAYDIKEKVSINAVKTNDFGRLMSTTFNGPALDGINTRPTDTSTTITDSTRIAKVTNLNGGSGGVIISAGNTINLEAPKISGSSLNVNAGTTNSDGKVNLIAAIDSREVSRTVTSRNTFWQSKESIGSLNQTLHMTNVNVPVGSTNFQAAGGISVQLPKGAALPKQIATLAKQPGNEYLGDLAKRSDIDWKQVEVINKTWDYKKAGITQETAIIVAIVVTIVTAGAASSAGAAMAAAAGETVAVAATATTAAVAGTTAGAVIAGATSAAITTLATQAAIAILNNKGDIAGALKELGSKENVKGLATAVITAGLVQGIGVQFGLDQINAKSPFINQLGANLVNGVAGSLVSTAINGGSLEDNLKNAIKTALISTAGAQLANGIGNITNDNQLNLTDIEKFANKFAHAVLGCAIGAATADSQAGCGAGALGAVAGSLGAELFDPANTKGAQAQQFGKLTAALAVLLVGGNANLMNIGGLTAVNAVANNRQLHKDELALAKTLAEKAKALGLPISEEDIKVQMRLMGNAALKVAPNTLTTLSPAQLAQSRNGVQDAIPYVSDGLSNPVSYLEVAGQANQSIQDFIVSNTTSGAGYIPGQSPYIASNPSHNDPVTSGPPSKVIPTAKCAYLDAGCIAGTNQQQNPSKPMTLAERKAAGEYFGNLSTQYQMIATLAVAGGQTGAPVVLTYEIAAGIAGLLEQGFAPSTGKVIIDTVVVDLAVKQIAERFGVPISIANIVAEKYIKPNLQGAKDSIDNIGNKK